MPAPSLAEPFDLIIESTGSATSLPPPPTWTHTQHIVSLLTVDAHTRPPDTACKTSLGPALLTFHDVGQHAGSCFGPFLSFCRTHPVPCPELDAAVAHYHLTAPGHTPDAPDLREERVDVESLVKGVAAVLERFGLRKVVGLGVGTGAGILLRAALRDQGAFAGLALVSPEIAPAGVVEKLSVSADGLLSKQLGLGLSRRAKDRFLWRWLSDEAREINFEVIQSIEESLDRLNAGNLMRLLSASTWRDELPGDLGALKAKTLLVTGKESVLRYHTDDAFPQCDPSITSWLDVQECGSLVHEEYPDKVAQALSLFLRSFPPVN